MTSGPEAVAARLAAINRTRHGDKAWSKAALLREYFRRAAHWADVYGCDTGTPFFDTEYLTAPIRGWRECANTRPMPSFAPAYLDEIDPAGSMAEFGFVIGPDGRSAGR